MSTSIQATNQEVRETAGNYVLAEAGGEAVPAGYKRTEVGVIPEDWSTSTVAQQFEIKLGKMLDAEKNRGLPKPYIGNKAVQWGRIDVFDLSTMAMSRSDTELFRLQCGDVLVCEGGEVGRAAIWDAPIEECYFQKALHRLRPTRGFDTRLIVALLRYWSDHGLLANYVTQTSIAHLTREKFAQLPLPVPGREEQHAIAVALSDVDALLAKLEQLLVKKRDLKQAAMQQLLTGDIRLPGFVDKWVLKRFGDVLTVRHGKSQHAVACSGGQYPILASGGEIGRTNHYLYDKASVLIGRKGTIDKPQYVDSPFWTVDTLFYTEIAAHTSPRFMFYKFGTINWRGYNEASGVPSLNASTIENIEFSSPDLDEQTAIATILSDMDTELAGLETRRTKTRELKQGMMQALLTGRIRLV
jgi:type I restriction enzyme S subunit